MKHTYEILDAALVDAIARLRRLDARVRRLVGPHNKEKNDMSKAQAAPRKLIAKIRGTGRQLPTTQARLLPGATVINSTGEALELDIPGYDTAWVARSQICTHPAIESLTEESKIGDSGNLLLPDFIFKRWKGAR